MLLLLRSRLALVSVLLLAGAGQAQTTVTLTPVAPAANFGTVTAIRSPFDGSRRLFVVEQCGTISILQNGAALATPFLTQPVSCASEQGLLGLAFHPNYAGNGTFFLFYTEDVDCIPASECLGSSPDQVIARFSVSGDPNVANPLGVVVLRIPDHAGNHNGGDIHFGPDGYLYISSGDGGSQNDPDGFAQCLWRKPEDGTPASCAPSLTEPNYFLLGKILRIDVDTTTPSASTELCGTSSGATAQYAIPASNPHAGTPNTCDEIWAYGFRNPYRFSFDRANGDMFIGDVGQDRWEEISHLPAASAQRDFGWRSCEGTHARGSCAALCGVPSAILPILEYRHSICAGAGPSGCSVTGGFRFRGPSRRLNGVYFYGDYCNGDIYVSTFGGVSWSPPVTDPLLDLGFGVTAFGEDQDGFVYVAGSSVQRLTPDNIFDDGFN